MAAGYQAALKVNRESAEGKRAQVGVVPHRVTHSESKHRQTANTLSFAERSSRTTPLSSYYTAALQRFYVSLLGGHDAPVRTPGNIPRSCASSLIVTAAARTLRRKGLKHCGCAAWVVVSLILHSWLEEIQATSRPVRTERSRDASYLRCTNVWRDG